MGISLKIICIGEINIVKNNNSNELNSSWIIVEKKYGLCFAYMVVETFVDGFFESKMGKRYHGQLCN